VRYLALVLVVLGSFAVAGAAASPRDRNPSAVPAKQVNALPELESEVLTAINEVRASKGVGPLRLNSGLSGAALGHSVSMAEQGYFSHSDSNGAAFWLRIKRKYGPDRRHAKWEVGENIVWASPGLSSRQAIGMWLESRLHRENLLNRTWRELGLGAIHVAGAPGVFGGLDVTILTADFGVR
jgi:uncharacterized protein YkwD